MKQDLIHQYITEEIFKFFTDKGLTPGDRYNIYFEKIEEVQKQFAAFDVDTFDYDEASYKVSYIQIGDVKLVIACNNEETTEDFLTKLRNKVSQNEGIFTNTAILFIHSTQLDSLTGGTESLLKEGMPLHVEVIKEAIRNKIEQADFLKYHEIKMLLDTIEQQKSDLFEDNQSLFDFKVFLEIIAQKSISDEQYKSLGLFKDDNLKSLENDSKSTNKRIRENRKLFDTVDQIHKYGNPSEDLEKHFVSDGVKALSNVEQEAAWYLEDFMTIHKWADEKKKGKKPEYSETIIENDGLIIWEKPEGSSKAKQRQRNIIVFNSLPDTGNACDTINLLCKFNTNTQQANISHSVSNTLVVNHSTSGHKIKLNLTPKDLRVASRCKVKYTHIDKNNNDKTNFEFRIFILPMAEKLLKSIKTNYVTTIKQGAQFIEVRTDNIDDVLVFNEEQESEDKHNLTVDRVYNLHDDTQLLLTPDQDYEESFVNFSLEYKNATIPFRIKIDHEELRGISGLEVWQQKRIKQESFQYHHESKNSKEVIKLKQGNHEYTVRDEFRENLKLEKELINSNGFYWQEKSSEHIEATLLEIPASVEESFKAITQYYREKNLLPSLAFWDDSLRKLIKNFIEVFLHELKVISTGSPLNKQQRNLENIGVIKELHGKERVKYTPLHPINLVYQLALYKELDKLELPNEIAGKLTPLGIVPYMYGNIVNNKPELFAPIEQTHSQEWLYFHSSQVETSSASKRYAPKLVKDKIEEFIFHFHYLFIEGNKTPLKINLINLGDCKEAFQGIFNYYKSIIQTSPVFPIDVYIYGSDDYITKFEEFSFHDDIEVIESEFGISLKLDRYDPEDILNVFRQNVHFYNKQLKEDVEYAHLSFYQFKQSEMGVAHNTTTNVPTGLSLHGLVNDIPSVFLEESYRTGFGSLYLPKEQSSLLEELAIYYNALIDFAKSDDPFNPEQAVCTVISESSKKDLEQLYSHSQWITFIDPKVDLNYFKGAQDVVIIHYSDQYSNTSGYDAITVTRKAEQYQFVIEEHLNSKPNISIKHDQTLDIINMFNALNGDWLLRLISHSEKAHFDREKMSILSAAKVSLSLFHHNNIIWVPVSLEEVLRISGGAGLQQKDGIFSAKNLGLEGKHSDDLLMIGLEEVNGELMFYLYPVEVKIGKNTSNVIDKAVIQAQKTKESIYKTLNGDGFQHKFYRNFFAKMVLVSAEKMKIYSVWKEQNWNKILTDYRHKLLNDGFTVSNKLKDFIGEFAIISFKEDIHVRKVSEKEDGLLIELLESDGYHHLLETTKDLQEFYQNGKITDDLLSQKYTPDEKAETVEPEVVEEIQEKIEATSNGHDSSNGTSQASLVEDGQPLSVLFGHEVNYQKPVLWHPTSTDKVMHTNTGIIGTMGTGKTQFTKSLITQLVQNSRQNVNSTPIGILIFDYKGDYIKDEFVKATDAKVFDLFHLPYNPLAIDISESSRPLLPLHIASNLKETITTAFNLGIKQSQKLQDVIMQSYDDKGIHKANKATWGKVPPSLGDICEIYLNDEDVNQDSLYAALKKLHDFEIFEPNASQTKSLFDLVEGVTVINLSGYDDSIQNLVVAITLDVFYSQMQKNGHSTIKGNFREITKMILVDEADNFLSKNFNSLRKILKEGREFGVGTILSTQFLNHFSTGDNEYSNYILTWIIHKVTEIKTKEIDSLFNLEKGSKETLISEIKNLEKHYSMVNLAGSEPIFMKDRAFWELVK